MLQRILFSLIGFIFFYKLNAQRTTPTIINEADVPSYELPQLLITLSGEKTNTPSD